MKCKKIIKSTKNGKKIKNSERERKKGFVCGKTMHKMRERELQIYSKMIGIRRVKNKRKIGLKKSDIKVDSSGNMKR